MGQRRRHLNGRYRQRASSPVFQDDWIIYKHSNGSKTVACFGIKVDQAVVTILAATDPEHTDIHDKLEQVISEGFMFKVGTSHFRFVHDKVREAAYSLIPHKDKNQVSMHGGD